MNILHHTTRLLAALLAIAGLFYAWAVLTGTGAERTPRAEEGTPAGTPLAFDAKNPPIIQREVDYTQGPRGNWWPKGESPLLAGLVAEGKYPPVAERTGPEPLVLEGCEGPGKYGGSWLRLARSLNDVAIISDRLSCANLVRWSPMGYPIRPHLAKRVVCGILSKKERSW
jgi:hypothetical protein